MCRLSVNGWRPEFDISPSLLHLHCLASASFTFTLSPWDLLHSPWHRDAAFPTLSRSLLFDSQAVCIRLTKNLFYPSDVSHCSYKTIPPNIHQHFRRRRRHFLWSKTFHVEQFCSTWQCCLSCGSKFLHMTINFTPRDKIACHVEQFYHVKQWEIAPHL